MSEVQKRRFSRIQFTRKVTLSFQGKSYGPCRIKDLSLSGMFVFGEFNERKGQTCQVIFRQTGLSSKLTTNAAARVIRLAEEGLAIEFTSMAFDSYMFLQTTLLYTSDDPFAISQDFPEDSPFELTEIAPEISMKKKIIKLDPNNISEPEP